MRRSPPVRMKRSGAGTPAVASRSPSALSSMDSALRAPARASAASRRAAWTMSQRPPYATATVRSSRSRAAVRSSAAAMRPVNAGARRVRSPMNRMRTPLASSSATSRSSDSRNSCMSRLTSPAGRCQFSLEKANSVSARTPWRTDSSIVARTARVPARCPAARGSDRCSAQRPLPSMITATWRGTGPAPTACGTAIDISDLQQLFLFLGQHGVDIVHVPVGELLDLLLGATILVFRDQPLLEHLLELVHEVVAHRANRDARTLGLVLGDLGELLAALLRHGRQGQADHLSRGVGRQAEVRLQDGFLDRLDRALVPRCDDQRA